jgi:hypothetical protein
MSPVTLRRNPLRNVASAGPWRATVYLFSYAPVGTVLFGGVLGVVVVSFVLNITWLGLPLLVGAAAIVRGAAQVERRRAVLIGRAVPARPRYPTGPGMFAKVRGSWRDLGTWRACAYLLLLFPALLIMDVVALVLWVTTLAGVTLPAWFWSVPLKLPGGGRTHGVWVGFAVNSLPLALLFAVGCAVVGLGVAYAVVGAALVHARVARSMLGPDVDPLAEAKRMLVSPGPLTV